MNKLLFFFLSLPIVLQAQDYFSLAEDLSTIPTQQEYLAQAESFAKENNHQKALACYTQFLKKNPTHFKALVAQGTLLRSMGKRDEAFASLCKARIHCPNIHEDMLSLGNALLHLGNSYFDIHETEKAIEAFKKILTISDALNAVHHNIAFTLSEQVGAYQESLHHYRKALEAQPNNVETHFCYALSLLATGNLLEGFSEYEWRWKRFKHQPRALDYPVPHLWTGQPLAGKRILLIVEQGIGDTLMFIRYAKLLKEQGAIVFAETQKPITQFLSLCPYIDRAIAIGTLMPHFDYQIPMLNLPLIFKTTLETIPAPIPYLYAQDSLIEQWKIRLQSDKNFKIGICWRGDAAHGSHKFMPIDYFAQLAKLDGISVYSLQKNDPSPHFTPAQQADGTSIKQFEGDFDESHGRFMDTAAVMKNMDLIITVDTSIAHLAGGLGVPTWLVLPSPAEWRWMTGIPAYETQSPWYPSMRLFRQKKYGDWQDVFEEITQALGTILHLRMLQ